MKNLKKGIVLFLAISMMVWVNIQLAYAVVLFKEDFETGTIGNWTDTNGIGTSVSTSIKHQGTYALKHTTNAGTDWVTSWVNKQIAPQTVAHLRAFVYFEMLPASGNRFYLQSFSTPNVVEQATVFVDENHRWSMRYRASGATLDASSTTALTVTTGKWYCVEFMLRLGIGTGEFHLWVDQTDILSRTGLDNLSGEGVSTITYAWSLLAGTAPIQTYVVYKDDFIVSTEYIGPNDPSNGVTVGIQPQTAAINLGQTVSFTSSVSGVTPTGYQWYVDGTPKSGATTANWVFSPTVAKTYTVYLLVNGLYQSNIASVVVTASGVVVTISPATSTINVGQSVTFSSYVTGTTPSSYQWHLDGSPVSGATTQSWTFTPSSSGTYTVRLYVDNQYWSNTASVTVTTVSPDGDPLSQVLYYFNMINDAVKSITDPWAQQLVDFLVTLPVLGSFSAWLDFFFVAYPLLTAIGLLIVVIVLYAVFKKSPPKYVPVQTR